MSQTIRVGHWYFRCCIEDLYRIDTEEELAEVREEMALGTYPFMEVHPSLESALASLPEEQLSCTLGAA